MENPSVILTGVTCISDVHKARLEFESSEEFTNKMHIRHRIEEKTEK